MNSSTNRLSQPGPSSAKMLVQMLAANRYGTAFAGTSAARIHGIGDLWDDHFDFITPVRRQSQRGEVRYRKRLLDPRDVTSVDGLPVLTVEATIADLVETVGDLSLVADAGRDAWRNGDLDTTRLTELLGPAMLARLTEANGLVWSMPIR